MTFELNHFSQPFRKMWCILVVNHVTYPTQDSLTMLVIFYFIFAVTCNNCIYSREISNAEDNIAILLALDNTDFTCLSHSPFSLNTFCFYYVNIYAF